MKVVHVSQPWTLVGDAEISSQDQPRFSCASKAASDTSKGQNTILGPTSDVPKVEQSRRGGLCILRHRFSDTPPPPAEGCQSTGCDVGQSAQAQERAGT